MLVPVLLAVCAAEFAVVVAWYLRAGIGAQWSRKAALVALVLAGGAAAFLAALGERV